MPRYALVENSKVTEIQEAAESPGQNWLETNTYEEMGTKHGMFVPEINWAYSLEHDLFVPPQPYPSWAFNFSTSSWKAPITRPQLVWPQVPRWNESTLNWDIITIVE